MNRAIKLGVSCLALCFMTRGIAGHVRVNVYKTVNTGHGRAVGVVEFTDTSKGVLIEPQVHDLPPGAHGFHVHEIPQCGERGKKAGGHFDPEHTGKHLGPFKQGHLGDLPVLWVDPKGNAVTPMLAPRLNTADLKHRAIIIHAGGDNYSDLPLPLGGGGARIACGIIPE